PCFVTWSLCCSQPPSPSCDPLSLHDALPIWVGADACPAGSMAEPRRRESSCHARKSRPRDAVGPVVPKEGLEPSRCRHRRILSPLRLPVPPLRRGRGL